jgi:hypothetical protein
MVRASFHNTIVHETDPRKRMLTCDIPHSHFVETRGSNCEESILLYVGRSVTAWVRGPDEALACTDIEAELVTPNPPDDAPQTYAASSCVRK